MGRKKAKLASRTQWLLFAAGCLSVTAIAYWQYSYDAPSAKPPAPLQLTVAAAPAPSTDAAPAVLSKDIAAVEPVKDAVTAPPTKAPATKAKTTKAPTTSAPVLAKQNDSPAVTVERRENVVPPSAPKANKSPAEAYEAMARASLQNKDYDQARQHIGSALAHGGKASFMIIHDHSRGNFDKDDPKATCVGELTIDADEVKFEPREEADRFAANWSDVRDAGGNRFFGSGRGGFHVTINTGGKYKNFNLAPESKEKAEGKLILDLMNAYSRKSERASK